MSAGGTSTGRLTVVIAPDSLKGSLSARHAAIAIAEGWAEERPGDTLILLPQADGGEGTVDALESAVPGALRRSAGSITGPDCGRVTGEWLELPDGTAVIELAQSSGLPLMAALDPVGSTTAGLGEVMAAALEAGAARLVIGLGGSASTDGGAGALSSLGLRLLDAEGAELARGGGALAGLHRIDAAALLPSPTGGIQLLSDVDAPLLGPAGAAAVFGPQKGATADQVLELDAALSVFAAALGGDPTAPGSGAAGGTGYGLAAALDATLESGADRVAELSGLVGALATADVIVTGEGRFDRTSLGGKVVGRVLERLSARHDGRRIRAVVIAGSIADDLPPSIVDEIELHSLTGIAGSVSAAMTDPATALREAGRRAALAVRVPAPPS